MTNYFLFTNNKLFHYIYLFACNCRSLRSFCRTLWLEYSWTLSKYCFFVYFWERILFLSIFTEQNFDKRNVTRSHKHDQTVQHGGCVVTYRTKGSWSGAGVVARFVVVARGKRGRKILCVEHEDESPLQGWVGVNISRLIEQFVAWLLSANKDTTRYHPTATARTSDLDI